MPELLLCKGSNHGSWFSPSILAGKICTWAGREATLTVVSIDLVCLIETIVAVDPLLRREIVLLPI